MKIVHIVEPFAAGLVTFIKTLIENHQSASHIIIHGERKNVVSIDDVKKMLPDNVQYYPWTKASREISLLADAQAFLELYRILKLHKDADIVHLHSSKAGFLGRIVCYFLGIKNVIFTPNGVSYINTDISKIRSRFYQSLEKVGSLFPGIVVATSDSELVALKSSGIEARLIYNGTDITPIKVCPETSSNNKKFRIVTCGRIAPQKAPNLFNRIAAQLAESKDVEFVWVGSGIEREKLQSENIRVTGWLNSEQVAEEICNADLYVSTARWEGMPFAVLEAMNFGKPLLLSRCIGNNDLVEEGVNGYQYESASEAVGRIKFLMENKKSLAALGDNSRQMCMQQYRIEDTAKNYKHLYMEVAYGLKLSKSFRKEHFVSTKVLELPKFANNYGKD